MDLHLKQLIIHELEKDIEASEASVFLSDHVLPIDEDAAILIEKLNDTFIGKNDLLHGYLASPEDALFPGYFQELSEADFSEEAFIAFSKSTMNALQLSLQGVVGAKGGYLVYADYIAYDTRSIAVYLVRDTDGIVFRRKEGLAAFDLDKITHLDINKLAMAGRITVAKYQQDNGRYVDLIKHAKSQKEISEYFINWIGLEQPESSKELTQTFMHVVDQLPLPVDAESGAPMQEEQFRDKVLKFASQSPQKVIELEKFDQHFYGSEPTAQKFLRENDVPLDAEFRVDQSEMKRHYNHRISAEGISLGFARHHMKHGLLSTDGDNVIIHSPQLVEQLLDLLDNG